MDSKNKKTLDEKLLIITLILEIIYIFIFILYNPTKNIPVLTKTNSFYFKKTIISLTLNLIITTLSTNLIKRQVENKSNLKGLIPISLIGILLFIFTIKTALNIWAYSYFSKLLNAYQFFYYNKTLKFSYFSNVNIFTLYKITIILII